MGAEPDPPRWGRVLRLLHRVARELLLPVILIMEAGHRFGRRLLQTEYLVEGACHKRGACCHHILMEWLPIFDRFPWLGRLALWKLTRFYNFYDKGYSWEVQDGLIVRVLGCHALGSDGRCQDYRLRPLFCRTYPEVPLIGRPLVLRGCGYGFRRRDGQQDKEAHETSKLVQINGRMAKSSVIPQSQVTGFQGYPEESSSLAVEDQSEEKVQDEKPSSGQSVDSSS